jgi:biotin carboxylase
MDRTKRWLVFVESNTSGTGRLFARAAAQCGYLPVLLAKDPSKYPYIHQDSVDYVSCDTSSLQELQKIAEKLMLNGGIAGIFSSSEYFIETAAALSRVFRLSGNDPAVLKICRNKWLQRTRMQAAGFPTPKFRCLTSTHEVGEVLQAIGLPAILKPPVGTGSVGVKLCATKEEAIEHAAQLLQRTVNERGMAVLPEALVEEYLEGPEFSVETFGDEVIGITRKHLSREPFFVETGHDFPADLGPEISGPINETVLKALRCLGLLWGPAHTELRWTVAGPAIIEINPRLGGGFIPELVRLATGVDMIRETVKLAANSAADMRPTRKEFASIRFLIPSRNGIIRNVKGVNEASQIEGVADIQVYKKIGEQVQLENDFRDRIGHIISHSSSRHRTVHAAEAALRTIDIETSLMAAKSVT